MIISRVQIEDYLNACTKELIEDNSWHFGLVRDASLRISLVEDFMYLLDGDNFDSDNLISCNYIKAIIQDNKDSKYAKRILMRKKPEMEISALFFVLVERIQDSKSSEVVGDEVNKLKFNGVSIL